MPNNNNDLIFDPSTIDVYSHKSKYITKNKKSLIIAIKNILFYYTKTNKPNYSNFLILVFSI